MNNEMKSGIDVAAVAGGLGSWLAILPDVAALLSIIWLALRIYETATVQGWIARRRERKQHCEMD